MNTDTLIHNLSLECQTVRPIEHPTTRLFKWFIAAVFLVAAGVWLLQPQLHVGSRLYDPLFIFPAIAMVCISFFCAMSAFFLTVPAERIRRFELISIVSVTFAFGSLVYFILMSDLTDPHENGIECIFRMTGLALAPGALMFHMLKKAFPMRPGLLGILAVISSLGLAEVGMQFVCRKTFASHIILWHFLPLAILAILGILIGRAALGWKLEQDF